MDRGKIIAFAAARPRSGRLSLMQAMASRTLEQGQPAVLVEIGHPGPAPVWKMSELSPLLLRNYLVNPDDGWGELAVSSDLAAEARTWDALSGAYPSVYVKLPRPIESAPLSVLEYMDLLLWMGGTNDPGYDLFLKTLSRAHFPHRSVRAIQLPDRAEKPGAYQRAVDELFSELNKDGTLRHAAGQTLDSPEASRQHIERLKNRIQPQLLETLKESDSEVRSRAQETIEDAVARESDMPGSTQERARITRQVMDEVLGLGPIEALLADPAVSEVMVNGADTVYVEKGGRLFPTPVQFPSEQALRTVIDRIVAPLGRRVDESVPLCDARLPDGSRVNIVLPPLALDGAVVTIRKFTARGWTLVDLAAQGSLSAGMASLLEEAVRARRNLIVSGGTGSGKTTLLNALSGCIPDHERIVTIEDAAELRLQKPHVVRLESRPPNAEGAGAISIRRLVMNALRMRPDRLVVGECRGGEALDMLQAMNTGHDGSMTTLHANSPRDALARLETLVLMAGIDLPVRVVREQIRGAVDLVIQLARQADGCRRVISVTEITGMEGDVISTRDLEAGDAIT